MPKENQRSSMNCSTNYGKCACCAYDSSNSVASSDGRRRLVVTSRANKEEESRERQVKTVVDSSIKVCSDCQTSYTPLWRNGPDGPMSLCNACGIRYRKRKISDRMEEREARKVFAITGNAESKLNSNAEETKKGRSGVKQEKMVMTLSEEEMRRRQREKQEKILMVLFRLRREARRWRQRALRERSAECAESEEVAEAALLLLYLSCGISVHF